MASVGKVNTAAIFETGPGVSIPPEPMAALEPTLTVDPEPMDDDKKDPHALEERSPCFISPLVGYIHLTAIRKSSDELTVIAIKEGAARGANGGMSIMGKIAITIVTLPDRGGHEELPDPKTTLTTHAESSIPGE